jgi:hypothetical protein
MGRAERNPSFFGSFATNPGLPRLEPVAQVQGHFETTRGLGAIGQAVAVDVGENQRQTTTGPLWFLFELSKSIAI